MKAFITPDKPGAKLLVNILAVLFWLAVWQVGSMVLSQALLLASPVTVLLRLIILLGEPVFWRTVAFSFGRIALGFFIAVLSAVVLAAVSARVPVLRILLMPLMAAVKASPVASFIILLLLWVPARSLSVVIAFLMVLPIIYTNLCTGIAEMDVQMLELSDVFEVSFLRRLRYLYLYQVLPYFRSACAVSLGLCWKSGIAAEVIGIPKGSIGERLYQAKIYLDTPDLFAWTTVIVLLSIVFGRLFLSALDALTQRLERM